MIKKIFILLTVIGALILLSKGIMLSFENYLSKTLKQNIKIENFTFYPFQMETSSLGGKTTLTYENSNFKLQLNNLELSNFEKINKTKKRKKMIVDAGKVFGELYYNPFDDVLKTKLHANKITVNGINLDRKLLFYNDVLGFNIVSLFKNYLNNLDKSNQTTRVSHLQFNITMTKGFITLDDVAFNSENFRIALFGNLHYEGDIMNFEAHLVDKNGCSIISQELTGNLKDPNVRKTKTLKKIIKAVPKSMFSTGIKMANFTRHNIGTVMPKNEQHVSNIFLEKGDIMFKKTTEIVMPKKCNVIYKGAVNHPLNYKKGFL